MGILGLCPSTPPAFPNLSSRPSAAVPRHPASGWSHVAGSEAGLRLLVQALTCPGGAAHPAPAFFSGTHLLSREALPLWPAGLAFHPGVLQVRCQVRSRPCRAPWRFRRWSWLLALLLLPPPLPWLISGLRKPSERVTFSILSSSPCLGHFPPRNAVQTAPGQGGPSRGQHAGPFPLACHTSVSLPALTEACLGQNALESPGSSSGTRRPGVSRVYVTLLISVQGTSENRVPNCEAGRGGMALGGE